MRTLVCLLFLVLVAASPASGARYAAVVVDGDTGKVLYGDRSKSRRYPASLTKMMTLYLMFERLGNGVLKLSTRLRVPRRATLQPPSRLGLARGSTISVRDAIRALAVKSANDVATTVAHHISGSERQFARLMTRKARALGMRHTQFRNASGLWHSQQWTTARDMALLARALMRDFPNRYHYFSLGKFKFRGRTYRSHNRLLSWYRGADGLKTGYISKSGFNLAFSAKRKGRRLITVVMGGKSARSRDRHVAALTNRIFAKLKPRRSAPSVRPGGANIWAVQVGAVRSKPAARRLAQQAARVVGLPPGGAWGAWPKARRRGGTLWRARLVGYGQRAAGAACRQLKRRGTDCFTVRHGAPPLPAMAAVPKLSPSARVASRPAAKPPKSPRAVAGQTAPPAIAAPPKPAPRVASGDYAVQVGAYANKQAARRQAQAAARLLRPLPEGIDVGAWPRRSKRGRLLYHSRLAGFDKAAARRACADLKRQRQDCLVLLHRPGRRARA